MRLNKISFRNFRCFVSEVIEFNNYTSLVGPNNCGKSTVLRALNLFYGGTSTQSSITSADFYIGAPADESMSIEFQFTNVVGEAARELDHYVRNESVTFELIATRDANGQIGSKCRGIRYGIGALAPFFEARTAALRKPIYERLQLDYPGELAPWRNLEQAEQAVRALEADRMAEHVPIPSEENAYGATGPVPILKKYLDWIYVPAVKDASSEASELRNSAFSKLILFAVHARCDFSARIGQIRTSAVNELQAALDGAREILTEVGGEIDREFKSLTTTPIDVALDWDEIEEIKIKEPSIKSLFRDGRVSGAPEIFGHGLQRTYLMALLGLAARIQAQNVGFRLLLGIEEPELYQHPPQARFLANALCDLSNSSCQILLTTHSPYFVSGRTFESIRVLSKRENSTKVHAWSVDEQRMYHAARKGIPEIGLPAALSGIDKSLETNIAEMFFASKVILVEGIEDVAIIEGYLKQIGRFSDFLRAGCHIIPVGGKQKMPVIIGLARGFSISVFCIADFDMNKAPHERKNDDIRRYAQDVEVHIPHEIENDFTSSYFHLFQQNIQSSIAATFENWNSTKQEIAEEWGWTVDGMNKDPMMLAEAMRRLVRGDIRIPALEMLVRSLENFWSR